jgi:hypothetical protein
MTESLNPTEFLTTEESAQVDQALLSSRERFSARVAIYCLRSLKQLAQTSGTPIEALSDRQIISWVEQDPSLNQPAQGLESDDSFKVFFARLVLSSLKPLHQISQEEDIRLEDLTIPQVIQWFEKEAKRKIEQR